MNIVETHVRLEVPPEPASSKTCWAEFLQKATAGRSDGKLPTGKVISEIFIKLVWRIVARTFTRTVV